MSAIKDVHIQGTVTLFEVHVQHGLIALCSKQWDATPMKERSKLLKAVRDQYMDDLTMRAFWGDRENFEPFSGIQFLALPSVLREAMMRNMRTHKVLAPVQFVGMH
jgi:hypothetical protein